MDWEWLSSRELDEVGYHWNRLATPDANPLGALIGSSSRYLYGVLGAEGIPCDLLTLDDGRPCLVARLPGTEPGDALVLSASTDPRDPLPSRKALEGVGLAVGAWVAMALARRRRWTFRRDLVLVAAPAAPSGEPFWIPGSQIRDRWPLRRGLLLSEGIGGPRNPGRATVVPVPVAAKGCLRVRVAAEASAGRPDEAIFRLLRALSVLESGVLDRRMTRVGGLFLEALTRALPPRKAALVRGWSWVGTVPPGRLGDPELQGMLLGMLQEEVVVLSLRAGSGLPPRRAEAEVLVRVLPGRPLEDPLTRIQADLGDEVSCTVVEAIPALEMEEASPLWTALLAVMEEQWPGMIAAPVLGEGPWHLGGAVEGLSGMGFSPVSLVPDEALARGPTRDDLLPGLRTWLDLVFRVCRSD